VSEQEIVELIVGAKLDHVASAPGARQDALLTLQEVGGGGTDGVSLTLHRGEILALVWLVGAGHRPVGRMVVGAERTARGEMRLGGEPYDPRTPRESQRRGVVYVPGDRLREGAFPTLDTGNNFALRDRAIVFGHGTPRIELGRHELSPTRIAQECYVG